MREGPLEVDLINPDGYERYKETSINGIDYFVAVPDQEYFVRVTVTNTSDLIPPDSNLIISLKVDGKDIGSSTFIHSRNIIGNVVATMFKGYTIHSDGMVNTLAFRFSNAITYANYVPMNINIGSLEVFLYSQPMSVAVRTRNRHIEPREPEIAKSDKAVKKGKPTISRPDSVIPLMDSKKFWLQPSVSTSMGKEVGEWQDDQRKTMDDVEYEYGKKVLVYSHQMKYHTECVLNLMRNANHKSPLTKRGRSEENTVDEVEVIPQQRRAITVIDLTDESSALSSTSTSADDGTTVRVTPDKNQKRTVADFSDYWY